MYDFFIVLFFIDAYINIKYGDQLNRKPGDCDTPAPGSGKD